MGLLAVGFVFLLLGAYPIITAEQDLANPSLIGTAFGAIAAFLTAFSEHRAEGRMRELRHVLGY